MLRSILLGALPVLLSEAICYYIYVVGASYVNGKQIVRRLYVSEATKLVIFSTIIVVLLQNYKYFSIEPMLFILSCLLFGIIALINRIIWFYLAK